MKTFLKILGAIVLTLAFLKGLQLTIEYFYDTFGKKYVTNTVEDFE